MPEVIIAAVSGEKVSIKELTDTMGVIMDKMLLNLTAMGNIQFKK